MKRSRISLRRRRAIAWDMIGGIALMSVAVAMLAALPFVWSTIAAVTP